MPPATVVKSRLVPASGSASARPPAELVESLPLVNHAAALAYAPVIASVPPSLIVTWPVPMALVVANASIPALMKVPPV